MAGIHKLNATLISQIAAGEVIDRPASVVRELAENSLDAGSTSIEIHLRQGGLSRIRVIDNGKGITKEELPLALEHHATSKIANFDDLLSCTTMGFRGEALASMDSVARLTIASRTENDEHGWEYSNATQQARPAAMTIGTRIDVDDLFYNTPARRKFLRNENTEWRHVYQIIKQLILLRTDCSWAVSHNGKTIVQTSAADTAEDNQRTIAKMLGDDFVTNSLIIDSAAGNMHLSGFISLPTYSRSRGDMQYLYVNNRPVRDTTIAHAVRHGYRDTLYHERYPAYLLMLNMEPTAVDHNVHPAKLDIRMSSPRLVHDFVASCIHEILAKSTKTRHVDPSTLVSRPAGNKAQGYGQNAGNYSSQQPSAKFDPQQEMESWKQLTMQPPEHSRSVAEKPQPFTQSGASSEKQNQHASDLPLGYAIGQLHNIYVLAQNSSGMVVVDMHAAHERILYEQLKRSHAQGKITSQQLLFPETLSMTQQQITSLEAISEQCAQLGVVFRRVSPTQIMVEELPAQVGSINIKQLMDDLAATEEEHQRTADLQEKLFERMATSACRAAIKAGRELEHAEMNMLLRDIEQTERSGQCNHGRPTWVQLGIEQLDKLFQRGK